MNAKSNKKQLEPLQDAPDADSTESKDPTMFSRIVTTVLDDAVGIPGTNIRFGLDPVLSLIPWLGSSTGLLLGSAMLVDAIRLRMPLPVLARMGANFLIDWLIGMIPVVGAFGDIAWRASVRNMKLLERTLHEREQVRKASIRYWLSAVGLLVALWLTTLALITGLVFWLWHSLAGY